MPREITQRELRNTRSSTLPRGADYPQIELYGLPLDRFVAERAALGRALRTERRREEAADIARLRKPSVAAWAVNQLVRTQGRALAELFDAGDLVRDVQSAVLAGRRDGRALRAAAERERAAVDVLVAAARGLLASHGHGLSRAIIDRVPDTLHAAALDDRARRRVREGDLERELKHVGLGADLGKAATSVRRGTTRKTPRKATEAAERASQVGGNQAGVAGQSGGREPSWRRAQQRREARERSAEQRFEAKRVEPKRAQDRKAARAAELDRRRLADRAARALHVVEERRERAAQALREADVMVAAARAEAEAAADQHRRAKSTSEPHRQTAERAHAHRA